MIYDDVVADDLMTCVACPTQYEGILKDGRLFYFRYRYGIATLGIGDTLAEAVENSHARSLVIGDGLDGVLSRNQYEDAFVTLYEDA